MDIKQTTLDSKQANEVISMLHSLASVCDNAESLDGMGFSKADLIGHYISEMPMEFFDDEWAITSLMLVQKYSRQLGGFGYDIQPYVSILSNHDKQTLDTIHSKRSERQRRRITVNKSGDFEIYFPNKQFLKGFDVNLVDLHDWMESVSIPHGYLFVIKRGARAFVADVHGRYNNWLIASDVLPLITDESLDTIDVTDAINYDLYIHGDDINQPLTMKWSDIGRFLDRVRAFSIRNFNGRDSWEVVINDEKDLNLLLSLILSDTDKVYCSKELREQLNNIEKVKSDLKEASEHREAAKKKLIHDKRALCKITLNENGAFEAKFTKFSSVFLAWIKGELDKEKQFLNNPSPHWVIQCTDHNITKLYTMINDDDWVFCSESASYLENSYFSAIEREAARKLLKETSLRLSSQKLADEDFTYNPSIINGEFLPFQKPALQFSTLHKNVLFGDDMGLGKTLEALGAAALNELTDSVNIICPAIARLTWRDEIQQWLPNCSLYIAKKATNKKNAEKEAEEIMNANFVIVSFKKAHLYADIMKRKEAKLFICDESQFAKNPKSQRTNACMNVAEAAERVYLLSGTALKNRPRELITQLQMLRILDTEFGGETKFLFDYCGATHNGWGYDFNGSSNSDELRKKLRETCMIRRLKDDVMEDLPEKRRMKIPVEIPNRKEYDAANNDFVKVVTDKVKTKAEVIALKDRLKGKQKKEFIAEYIRDNLENAAKAQALVHIGILQAIVGRGLQEVAIEWIKDFLESGEKLVVFAHHKEQQKYIYDTLKADGTFRVGKIFSGMSDIQRKQTEKDFQQGLYDVVICSIGSANTNITLTASTTVLTIEYLWVPGDHLQAEDRCRRIGTSRDATSIDCFYLHADNTVDDLFWKTLCAKFDILESVMDKEDGNGFDNMEDDLKGSIIKGMLSQFDFIKAAA